VFFKRIAKVHLNLCAKKPPEQGIFYIHYDCTFAQVFTALRNKWGVSPIGLFLILCTFAIGGSLAGFLAKKVMNVLDLGQDWIYGIVYILVVTLLWPLSVISVSLPFGQFKFFSNYLKKMGRKFGLISSEK